MLEKGLKYSERKSTFAEHVINGGYHFKTFEEIMPEIKKTFQEH